jgi:hypothetical protein
MIWNKPVQMPLKHLPFKAGKVFFRRQAGKPEQLADARDTDVADPPRGHYLPFPVWMRTDLQ